MDHCSLLFHRLLFICTSGKLKAFHIFANYLVWPVIFQVTMVGWRSAMLWFAESSSWIHMLHIFYIIYLYQTFCQRNLSSMILFSSVHMTSISRLSVLGEGSELIHAQISFIIYKYLHSDSAYFFVTPV